MKIWVFIKNDFRFLLRHHFYTAYGCLTFLLVLALSIFQGEAKEMASVILLITEITSFSSTFIAANLLLERSQGIYDVLFITPVKMKSYLCAKICSLSIPAVISGMIIVTISFGIEGVNIWMICSLFLTTVLFSLLGITLATRCESVNGFILRILPFGLFLIGLPLAGFLQLIDHPLLYLLPTQGTIILLQSPYVLWNWVSVIYAVMILIIWGIIFWGWSKRWFMQYVVLKGVKQ